MYLFPIVRNSVTNILTSVKLNSYAGTVRIRMKPADESKLNITTRDKMEKESKVGETVDWYVMQRAELLDATCVAT